MDELFRAGGGADPVAAGVIEKESHRLATILAQPRSKVLVEALTYCFRELIRNVVEHAHTPALWLAGMSWPRRNYLQVAVLDEGQGVRKSLSMNDDFRFATDLDALRAALRPGVSRNIGRSPSREKLERFAEERHASPFRTMQNAGYGLYLIQRTLSRGRAVPHRERQRFRRVHRRRGSSSRHRAPRHRAALVIQPTEAGRAFNALFTGDFARGPADRQPMLSPSKLRSLGLDSLVAGRDDAEEPEEPRDGLISPHGCGRGVASGGIRR